MFTRVKPLGWAFLEILTSTQMNQLDTNVSRAIDGLNGGTYALAVMLELAGAGVKFSTVAEFAAATVSFTGAGTVTVGADTTWTFQNPTTFNALATFAGGFTMPSGAVGTIEDGAQLQNDGLISNGAGGQFQNDGLIVNQGAGRFRRRAVQLEPDSGGTIGLDQSDVFYMPLSGSAALYLWDGTGTQDGDEAEFRQLDFHVGPSGHQVRFNGVDTYTFGSQATPGSTRNIWAKRIGGSWRAWEDPYP